MAWLSIAKQKFHLRKVTAKKLKFSEYEFNIVSLVNFKTNANFGIHQTKNLGMI